MKKQTSVIIFIWSAILIGWAFANPPSGTVGTTQGIITADASNNVGIATSTPATDLDINGTTTIRKSLNMTGGRILNVATPTAATDGVPLNYLSSQIATVSSSTTRLWGKGRPGATVENAAGQCTTTVGGRTVKISKSTFVANWDKSASACPAGWWVCTAAERDINGATANFGACPTSGAVARQLVGCDPTYENPAHYDNLYVPAIPDTVTFQTDIVWVADATATPHYGRAVSSVGGTVKDDVMCVTAPVWCCSY